MKTGARWKIWWVFVFSALLASACNHETSDDSSSAEDSGASRDLEGGDDEDEGGLTGTIAVDGSSTVYPFALEAVAAFEKKYPEVRPNIGSSGTGNGFGRFSKGDIEIANASRPIKPDELKVCQQNKIEFIELPIAYDGLTIVVNPKNDWIKQLTVKQLQQIYGEGGATKWSEIEEGWPDEEIKINSPGPASGTFDYFKEVVVGKEGEMRSDMLTSEDDNVIVTAVAGERTAIGYFGASYYFENKDKLRAVPIVNPQTNEAVVPSSETILSGSYAPFSRPLFVYVNVKELRRPEVKKLVQFELDNAAEFAKRVNYVPLQDEIYAAAQDHLKNRLSGTHFHTPDGEKRKGSLAEVYKAEFVEIKP